MQNVYAVNVKSPGHLFHRTTYLASRELVAALEEAVRVTEGTAEVGDVLTLTACVEGEWLPLLHRVAGIKSGRWTNVAP